LCALSVSPPSKPDPLDQGGCAGELLDDELGELRLLAGHGDQLFNGNFQALARRKDGSVDLCRCQAAIISLEKAAIVSLRNQG
jgi:hypothetical protein